MGAGATQEGAVVCHKKCFCLIPPVSKRRVENRQKKKKKKKALRCVCSKLTASGRWPEAHPPPPKVRRQRETPEGAVTLSADPLPPTPPATARRAPSTSHTRTHEVVKHPRSAGVFSEPVTLAVTHGGAQEGDPQTRATCHHSTAKPARNRHSRTDGP